MAIDAIAPRGCCRPHRRPIAFPSGRCSPPPAGLPVTPCTLAPPGCPPSRSSPCPPLAAGTPAAVAVCQQHISERGKEVAGKRAAGDHRVCTGNTAAHICDDDGTGALCVDVAHQQAHDLNWHAGRRGQALLHARRRVGGLQARRGGTSAVALWGRSQGRARTLQLVLPAGAKPSQCAPFSLPQRPRREPS